jgi:hypothetical protein
MNKADLIEPELYENLILIAHFHLNSMLQKSPRDFLFFVD